MTAGLGSCAVANPFESNCSSTAGRTLAFDTDPSCLVRIYVLGDPGCSNVDNVTFVDG
jgi:hypothetical protein